MSFLKCVAVAGALYLPTDPANAATLNFNVSNTWSASGHSFGAATVTGATVDNGGKILTNTEKVASWSGFNGGLGICSARRCTYGERENRYYDQHTIDGKNKNEMALVNFGSKTVEVQSVTFNYWDRSDDFDIAKYFALTVGSMPTLFQTNTDTPGNRSPKTFVFGEGALIGSLFGFGANGSDDEFKLKSIQYREISEVPLPAAAVLMLSGLAAFGALHRRNEAA